MFYQVIGKVICSDDENGNDGSLECCCAVGYKAYGGSASPVLALR